MNIFLQNAQNIRKKSKSPKKICPLAKFKIFQNFMIRSKEVNFVFKINEFFFLQNIQKERRLLQKIICSSCKIGNKFSQNLIKHFKEISYH